MTGKQKYLSKSFQPDYDGLKKIFCAGMKLKGYTT